MFFNPMTTGQFFGQTYCTQPVAAHPYYLPYFAAENICTQAQIHPQMGWQHPQHVQFAQPTFPVWTQVSQPQPFPLQMVPFQARQPFMMPTMGHILGGHTLGGHIPGGQTPGWFVQEQQSHYVPQQMAPQQALLPQYAQFAYHTLPLPYLAANRPAFEPLTAGPVNTVAGCVSSPASVLH